VGYEGGGRKKGRVGERFSINDQVEGKRRTKWGQAAY
jgi:hypothetical protein